VPHDVSLTGFDDLPFAIAMHPTLTTVAQDVKQIAGLAIERALLMAWMPPPDGIAMCHYDEC
jgi:DNA-binding LacI/PurR family transcriptional regulator